MKKKELSVRRKSDYVKKRKSANVVRKRKPKENARKDLRILKLQRPALPDSCKVK